VGLSPEKYLKTDPAFHRPAEPAKLVGSPVKIERTLSWKPQTTFEELVHEMVQAELAAIAPA
jgi:GDPmannose 4,6-dehydratase